MVTDDRARCDTREINQSFVLPFGRIQLQNGKRESSSVSLYSIEISRLEQKVELKKKQQVSLVSLFWEYLALVCTRLWPMNENQTFLWITACLSVCWRFIISLIQHFMGTSMLWHLYDVAAYNSVVFWSFWCGLSKKLLVGKDHVNVRLIWIAKCIRDPCRSAELSCSFFMQDYSAY